MAKNNGVLTYAFHGSAKQLARLRRLISEAVQEAVPKPDPGGPVEDWGQSGGWVLSGEDNWSQKGGWYLVVEQEAVKVSQPDPALTKVTATVYEALSRAKQQG